MSSVDEWKKILRKTFSDKKISRSEKKALQKVVEDSITDHHQQSLFRSQAFDLARTALNDETSRQILGWLEEVIKVSVPPPDFEPIRVSTHFSPGEECRHQITTLIEEATSTIDICVFTITDNRISGPISEAYERGIKVRIITDDEKMNDPGSDIREFQDRGIPLVLDNQPSHMHHKFAIFDGQWVLSGSYNWTRSAANQHENLMITNDKKVIDQFQTEFDRLWKKLGG